MTKRRDRSRSGSYVHETQRHTTRVVLRLRPEMAEQLRARAMAEGLPLSRYVERLIATDLAIV